MKPGRAEAQRATALSGVVALQALCAAFFLADVLGDLGRDPLPGLSLGHNILELGVVAALISGTIFGALELRRLLARQARIEDNLRAAGGAFGEVLEEHFSRWSLTGAERDVAIMTIKGFSTAEMAAVRGTAEGTIKAQSAAVYAKAGVTGRAQLLSLFIEELLSETLVGPP